MLDVLLWVGGVGVAVYVAGVVGYFLWWIARAPELAHPPMAWEVIRAGFGWPVILIERLTGG